MKTKSNIRNKFLITPGIAGLFIMPLRWVCAWIMFAAAWRRLVLKPESLDPSSPLYEGIKLNHFLPDAALTSSMIKYVLLHPSVTQAFLIAFTTAELCMGIVLFVGFASRFMSLILLWMFINLMLTVGWMGTTCLDEWTVASFGIGFAVSLFLCGSGPFSLDAYISKRYPVVLQRRHISWLFIREVDFIEKYLHGKKIALACSVVTLLFVLATNQYFVGGVYGPFHNPAIKPNLRLHAALIDGQYLNLSIYRNQGPDTYGSFLIDMRIEDNKGHAVVNFDQHALASIPDRLVHNHYLDKIKSNGYALLVPLGALATLKLPLPIPLPVNQSYSLVVTDISGESWRTPVTSLNHQPDIFNPMDLVIITTPKFIEM